MSLGNSAPEDQLDQVAFLSDTSQLQSQIPPPCDDEAQRLGEKSIRERVLFGALQNEINS